MPSSAAPHDVVATAARALGRGVVILSGQPVPAPWTEAPVVTIDAAALADPTDVVATLHRHWSERRPVVVALDVDPAQFREPESWMVEPWTVDPGFMPWRDRLHFLVWNNNVDARTGEPVWWWTNKAARVGAQPTPDGPGDIRLPDGSAAVVDGGPRGPRPPGVPAELAIVPAESVEAGRLNTVPDEVEPDAELAPDQLAAVAHGSGPARVLAPAGSGKTRVLTERLRHLLVDRRYEPGGVLAVAYNVKARDEMVERTASFHPRVQTLNGLCYSLLREHRGTAPRVLDERQVRRLVDGLTPRIRARVNTDPVAPYLEALSTVRLGLQDPVDVEEDRGDVPGFAELFGFYRQALADQGVVDFDEQVYGALEALLHDGPFRRASQQKFRHLLVDEFQDLTPAHLLIVRLLSAPTFDVFGVGDDDQVIYGHAGADPAFLVDFDRYFPGAGSHLLEVNYRCPVAVVDGARHLLGYNRRRVDKTIHSGPDADPAAEGLVVRQHSADSGASTLVEVVQDWLADPGVAPADVAVLARVNSLLLAPHVALVEAGVPVQSALSSDVLARTGVRAALAYLRLAAQPDNMSAEDLTEVYRRPSRGMPQWVVKWFRAPMSVSRLRRVSNQMDDVKVAAKFEDLAADLDLLAGVAARGASTRDLLTAIRDQVGLGSAMELLDRSKGGEGSSQLDDLEALRQVADLHPEPATFEPWLRAGLGRPASPDGVLLSTVHRVKGREWPRVAVFGVTAGLLPHRLAENVEEERRVLHVAITRGRQRVTVLGEAGAASPFVAELDGSAPAAPVIASRAPPTA